MQNSKVVRPVEGIGVNGADRSGLHYFNHGISSIGMQELIPRYYRGESIMASRTTIYGILVISGTFWGNHHACMVNTSVENPIISLAISSTASYHHVD
jgi:hypothetical protein